MTVVALPSGVTDRERKWVCCGGGGGKGVLCGGENLFCGRERRGWGWEGVLCSVVEMEWKVS